MPPALLRLRKYIKQLAVWLVVVSSMFGNPVQLYLPIQRC